MDVQLRALTSDDRPALTAILRATSEFTDDERGVALELIDEALRGDDDYHFVIAEAGGTIVGYACFGPAPMTDGVWDLYWIAVDPSSRSNGIGLVLLRACESEATSSGARMMLIETASNPAYVGTRRFYERAGYAEASRLADYYRIGDDKITYRKTLR